MGKAKRQKNHTHAARKAADASTAVAKEQQQQDQQPLQMDTKAGGVLDGLTSLNAITRESSCAAVASLFEKVDGPEAGSDSWAAAQRLIASGLVKKLLPRMVDRAPGVKMQATGAMRNISAVRDPRMCEILVSDDCLTPVLNLLDRMSSPTSAAAPAPTADVNAQKQQQQQQQQQAMVMNPEQETVVVAQLVATLCNLLAAVDIAVGRFTRQGGLEVVMRLLLPEGCRGSSDIFGGALQALHVATDSNEDLARQLASLPGGIDQISALVRGADLAHVKVSKSMRVQAAGVLVNVAGLLGEAARGAEGQTELSQLVLPLLLEQMAYDPIALKEACVALAADKAAAAEEAAAAENGGSSMDVDGDVGAGAGAAAGAAAGVAAAATPMQMETASNGGSAKEDEDPAVETANNGGMVQGHGEDKKEAGAAEQPDIDAKLRWEWKLAVAEPLKLTAEVMANLCALAVGDGEEEEEEEWDSGDEDAMERAACSGGGGGGMNAAQRQQANGGAHATVLLDAMADAGALERTVTTLRALLSPTPKDQQAQPPAPASASAAAAAATLGGRVGSAVTEATPPPATAEGAAAAAAAAELGSRLPLPAGVAGDLADLRATVALCAANLVQNLPPKVLGESPLGLWSELCGMCEAAMERAPSCVETVTGVMWGLVRRAGPAVAAGVRANAANAAAAGATKPAADPLPLIKRLCDPETTRAFEARVNAVGILGALGSAAVAAAAATSGGGADVGLGRALVQAMEDPHVLVQAEALNAVMDVYGDDGQDAAFRASGAPAALAVGVPAFKRKVKQEGKVLGRDAMCHLKETALNASRFVKYKQASGAAGGRGGR